MPSTKSYRLLHNRSSPALVPPYDSLGCGWRLWRRWGSSIFSEGCVAGQRQTSRANRELIAANVDQIVPEIVVLYQS